MKKLLIVLALVLLTMSVASATFDDYCTDTDGGKDIWTPGTATEWDWHWLFGWDSDLYPDDCDGASENLKEGYCDSTNGKFANIKCSDYGAVCKSVIGAPDYCACPSDKWFDGDSCETPVCGDGQVNQPGETCDDGNQDNTDSCTNACIGPVCGDSFVQPSNYEECDDSNSANNDGCTFECKVEECGDGVQQTSEECDVGTGNFQETCTPGYEESCMVCTSSCTIYSGVRLYCGDLVTNGPEECDGSAPEHYICEEGCVLTYVPYCGDGTTDTDYDEECDDGNDVNGDGCDSQCLVEFCGDTVVNNVNEECDGGDMLNGQDDCEVYGGSCQYCSYSCTNETAFGPYCGDATINGDEGCDDGNTNNNDGCSSLCIVEFCGDGIVNGNEACDDGLNNGVYTYCNSECTERQFCGDGEYYSDNLFEEQCELPGTTDNDNCAQETESCEGKLTGVRDDFGNCDAVCGCVEDAFEYRCIQDSCGAECGADSDCDDQNAHTADTCNAECGCEHTDLPYCGDGIVNDKEECDGAEGVGEHEVCNSDCILEVLPYCGDGILGTDEKCDDGNIFDGDGCSAICEKESTDVPEFTDLTAAIAIGLGGFAVAFLRRRN